jgi:hypothetical protein
MAHIDNKPITIDHIQTWIFDLDNTIYPAASRLFDQVRHRMTDYIQHHFSLERDAAKAMQKDLFLRHRTTMKGLMVEHGTDPHHFMDYVHDIDLSTLGYDTELNEGIGALSGRRLFSPTGLPPMPRIFLKHMEFAIILILPMIFFLRISYPSRNQKPMPILCRKRILIPIRPSWWKTWPSI